MRLARAVTLRQQLSNAGLVVLPLPLQSLLQLVLDEVELPKGEDVVLEPVQLAEEIAGRPSFLRVLLEELIED